MDQYGELPKQKASSSKHSKERKSRGRKEKQRISPGLADIAFHFRSKRNQERL